MVKLFNALIAILMTLSSTHAQIRTGGVDEYTDDSNIKILYGITELEKHLLKKDAACSINKKLSKGQKLFDMYLILSMHQNNHSGFSPLHQCSEINTYLACLNDKTTSVMVQKYVTHHKYKIHLVGQHNISNAEADKVIKFFLDLPKREE